jgi:uncharacterized protein (DUF1810 family)
MGYLQLGYWVVVKKSSLAWPGGLRLGAKNSAWLELAWVRLASAEPGPASVELRVIARLAFIRLAVARLASVATAA